MLGLIHEKQLWEVYDFYFLSYPPKNACENEYNHHGAHKIELSQKRLGKRS